MLGRDDLHLAHIANAETQVRSRIVCLGQCLMFGLFQRGIGQWDIPESAW